MTSKLKAEGTGLKVTIGLAVLQIIFAIVIAAVTSTQLDDVPGTDFPTNPNKWYGVDNTTYCVLNIVSQVPPGRVCDFVYITVGFGLFFSLVLLIPSVIALRKRVLFLAAIAISQSLFAAFWWLVLAITINARAPQASARARGPAHARSPATRACGAPRRPRSNHAGAASRSAPQASALSYPGDSQRTAVRAIIWLEYALNQLVVFVAIWDRVRFAKYKKAKKIGASHSEKRFEETHAATQVLGATPIV
eukprot:scaffold1.g5651.t1